MAKTFVQAEEVVKAENKFANFDWEGKGDSIDFFWMDTADRTSAEYGDFYVMLGLKLNDLSSIEAAVETAELVSFIPRTIIKNRVEDGTMVKEELYRITQSWEKGEKFKDGRRAKAHGYEIKHLVLAEPDRRALARRYRELLQDNEGSDGMVKGQTSVNEVPDEPEM